MPDNLLTGVAPPTSIPGGAVADPYAGLTPDQIIKRLYSHGFDQAGVNALYAARGLANPPTVPASFIGGKPGTGRNTALYGADGKPLGSAGGDARDFLNNFNQTAADPYRKPTGISNFAGGALAAVGAAVGGPVWGAMTGIANLGNRALGNDGGSADFGKYGGIGTAVGSIYGAVGGPGSYGAVAKPTDAQVNSNAGFGQGALRGGGNAGNLAASGGIQGGAGVGGSLGGLGRIGSSGGGSMGGTSDNASGGWLDALIDIGGALYQGDAAKDAGKTQSAAAAAAIAEQRRQYDLNREDLAPYRQAGSTALGQISSGTADGGEFNRSFTAADFQKDPGYDFRMQEGSNAIQGANAATRGVQNGRTLAELTRYGQDYASGEYQNAYNRFNNDNSTRFNRLASIAGVGQTATNTGIASGNQSTNNISDLTLEQANASAAGRIGQANAYTQGAESLANWYRNRKYGGTNQSNWVG